MFLDNFEFPDLNEIEIELKENLISKVKIEDELNMILNLIKSKLTLIKSIEELVITRLISEEIFNYKELETIIDFLKSKKYQCKLIKIDGYDDFTIFLTATESVMIEELKEHMEFSSTHGKEIPCYKIIID